MMMDEVAKSVCNRQIQIGYRYSFFWKCQWWVGLVVCVCGFFFFWGVWGLLFPWDGWGPRGADGDTYLPRWYTSNICGCVKAVETTKRCCGRLRPRC
jgi:hypothetical protein